MKVESTCEASRADEAPLFTKLVEIDASGCETFFQADEMRFGPDVYATVAGVQAVGEPMRQGVDKEAVIFIELNEMRMRIDVPPRGRAMQTTLKMMLRMSPL